MSTILDPELFAVVMRVTTPLLLAALGILISARAGVLNIGAEGIMLSAALAAVLGSVMLGSPWAGLVVALGVGGALGLTMSLLILRAGTQVIVTGIALNIAASAGTALLLFLVTGDRGMSGSLDSGALPAITASWLSPWLSGHNVMTWLALAAVPATWIFLGRTALGLRLRAAGEDVDAARAAGLSTDKLQALALTLSGVLAGAAGAYLSLGYVTWFGVDMTAGRGFVALAAAVMGDGSTFGTVAAVILIAIAEDHCHFAWSLWVADRTLGRRPLPAACHRPDGPRLARASPLHASRQIATSKGTRMRPWNMPAICFATPSRLSDRKRSRRGTRPD
jgi:general nucleoside transport system permease protein